MAVSNEIAPEHLELCCEDPRAMIPLLANAGAVFLGLTPLRRSATTSQAEPHPADLRIGALRERARCGGLPPQGARHLRRPPSPQSGRSPRRRDRTRRGPRSSRELGDAPLRAAADLMSLTGKSGSVDPDGRREVALRPGYHSPQVEVEVRLNTNESPSLLRMLWSRRWPPSCDASTCTAIPTGKRPRSARRWPPTTAFSRHRCSAPTARTR